MQFQKVIRTQMAVAALGLTLFCAGAGAPKAQATANPKSADAPNAAALAKSKMADATELAAPAPADTPSDNQASSDWMVWIGAFLIWVGVTGVYFSSGSAGRFAWEIRSLQQPHNAARQA